MMRFGSILLLMFLMALFLSVSAVPGVAAPTENVPAITAPSVDNPASLSTATAPAFDRGQLTPQDEYTVVDQGDLEGHWRVFLCLELMWEYVFGHLKGPF